MDFDVGLLWRRGLLKERIVLNVEDKREFCINFEWFEFGKGKG